MYLAKYGNNYIEKEEEEEKITKQVTTIEKRQTAFL